MCGLVVFLLLLCVYCSTGVDQKREVADFLEKNRMVGVDAVHDTRIDKDTIITRNTKLKQKNKKIDNQAKTEERAPDWSYSGIPKEISAHVDQFKRNMTECLKEVQQKDKRMVKRLSPRTDSPVHAECLIACVLKRNGVIEKGKINKDNLLILVGNFFAKDTKLMKKLEKNLDRCIESSIRNSDECMMASKLNDCTNDLMANNKHKLIVNY